MSKHAANEIRATKEDWEKMAPETINLVHRGKTFVLAVVPETRSRALNRCWVSLCGKIRIASEGRSDGVIRFRCGYGGWNADYPSWPTAQASFSGMIEDAQLLVKIGSRLVTSRDIANARAALEWEPE